MNVYFPREVAGGATSSSGGEIRVNGVLLVPGETVKLRSSALRRKDWRDTLNVAVERQVLSAACGLNFHIVGNYICIHLCVLECTCVGSGMVVCLLCCVV